MEDVTGQLPLDEMILVAKHPTNGLVMVTLWDEFSTKSAEMTHHYESSRAYELYGGRVTTTVPGQLTGVELTFRSNSRYVQTIGTSFEEALAAARIGLARIREDEKRAAEEAKERWLAQHGVGTDDETDEYDDIYDDFDDYDHEHYEEYDDVEEDNPEKTQAT